MKNILLKIILVCLLVPSTQQCTLPDDDNTVFVQFEIDGLIQIDSDQTEYEVDDILWITITIPNTFDNQGTLITAISPETRTTFNLLETTDFENPSTVNLSENEIVSNQGMGVYESNVLIIDSELIGDSYQSNIGIILKSAGTFSLVAGFNPGVRNEFYFDGDMDEAITLTTTIDQAQTDNTYTFTVTE